MRDSTCSSYLYVKVLSRCTVYKLGYEAGGEDVDAELEVSAAGVEPGAAEEASAVGSTTVMGA